jgi:undecaprenyl phosphate N,N'-diacetylbacillosamine 1-phosphate transferase
MQTEVSSNTVQHVNNGGVYRRYIKRPMDLILSLCAIIVLAPVLLIIAILVRIKLGSPVLFKQKRPGLNEKIFTLYKFRTMTDERDENGELLPDEIRLTRFGKLLRSTSLDELPELFNIIKGDMSIVGPRPLLIQYLPLYDDHQKRRHEVRPGLSGLAMAKGRNALTWEEKFAYDTYYANHVSFLLDVKIIFWTMAIVFKREGINEAGHATVSEFMGSNKETGVEFK